MRIVSSNVYLGPSIYAHFRVIRLVVDLGAAEQWPTGRLGPPFHDALLAALPGLAEHGCSYEQAGGFVRRLREGEGTWLGHVLEHVAIELQNIAGIKVTFGKTRSNGIPGQYDVVYQYDQEDVGLEAGRLALSMLHHLLPVELQPEEVRAHRFDLEREKEAFIRYAQRRAFGPSTASLVKAAEERDVPWIRLNKYSLVQFGHGKYGKRIQATITSETRHIAVEIASDKEETNRLLADLGLPVPRQELIYDEEEAVKAAERLGYPVVVKPYNANHGRGVSIHLADAEAVRAAFRVAKEISRAVLVETFISGFDHRLLVVNGELVAAALREPGHVVGDGVHTVDELLEITNLDPRRGVGHEKVLTKLEWDHQAERMLAKKSYTRQTVPAEGEKVYLRSTGNLSTGGTSVDVTDIVHPDNREMALRAARAVGLDVCGVDFLTTDITKSFRETRGAICEVNAAPGFRMHVAPSEGKPRDVAGKVMDMLFPPGSPSRIPIAAITGTNGKTTAARMTAHILKMAGFHVGLATTDGVYIDGHMTVEGDMTGPAAARMILRDPAVDCAVLEQARGGLLRRGLGYRRCNVGAVLNVTSDHLGLKGVHTLEDLAKVKRIVVEVARDCAVLNADDPLTLKMADYTRAEHLCYVTMNPHHPLVREHIRAGARAVVLEQAMAGHMLTIYDKGQHIPLLWSHLIPAALDGKALHNVQNAMFAAAVAFSMNVRLEEIQDGLRTFDTTFFQAPGRMNVFHGHPFKVILDYGHNPAAVEAMVKLVERMEPRGRRLLVLAAPGDRRDEDVREIARVCAGRFDHVIVRRDDHLRGRGPDEIPAILKEALRAHGVPESRISVIPDEVAALDAALRLCRPDDLLLVFGDAIKRCWQQITEFSPRDGGSPRAPAGPPPLPVESREAPDLALEGHTIIRDGRGVRLAREAENVD
ncbi:MAG: cyanophycin synthetase [Planctomycetota bacterium]|nr:MAG: cyanophycin synthetase [Planctomycetota bacterium]